MRKGTQQLFELMMLMLLNKKKNMLFRLKIKIYTILLFSKFY